ncbi:hypothetical protein D0Z00_000494 [Geotrichum galactomycetum]|uniref:Uncharacterized protein n=1 Tax=Geotrichum galactomycetum TaxID=27317 RepID=A0ACB6V9X3_9ASCO|nr:hypothetical protein D0Z00_000494 [Geotrichum candidum]
MATRTPYEIVELTLEQLAYNGEILNTLQNLKLVKKYPIVEKGAWTYLNVYWKFIDSNRENTEMVTGANSYDLTNLRSTVMSVLKSAHNGIRQLCDIRAELGFAEATRMKIIFNSAIQKLSQQGYLERIYVYRPEAPERKYNCLRFLKDLPPDDDYEVEEENDTSGDFSDGEEATNDKVDSNDLKDISTMNIVEPVSKQVSSAMAIHNPYFPVETQIFSMIEHSGVEGIPGVDIIYKLTGGQYAKIVSRIFDLFGSLAQNKMAKYTEKSLGYLVIIRGTDFSARVKFYRYFTNKSYVEFSNKPSLDIWGEFQTISQEFANLSVMEEKSIVPSSGHIPDHFKGKLEEPSKKQKTPANNAVKRGRPRKNPLPTDITPKVEKRGRKKGSKNAAKTTNTNASKDVSETSGPIEPVVKPVTEPVAEPVAEPVVESVVESVIEPVVKAVLEPVVPSKAVETDSELSKVPSRKKRLRQTTLFETTPKKPRTRSHVSHESSAEPIIVEESSIASIPTTGQPEASEAAVSNSSTTESINEAHESSSHEPTIDTVESNPVIPTSDDAELRIDPDILKTEAEVTQAIKEATKHFIKPELDGSSSIDTTTDTTPTVTALDNVSLKQVKKKPNLSNINNQGISIVLVKRVNQIQTLLRENDGVVQGGIRLVHNLNERFNKENKGDMDKKTVLKALDYLENIGEVWQVHFEFSNPKTGFVSHKTLLFHHSVPKDPEFIEAKKKEVFNEVKKLPSAPQLKVAKLDFKFYTEKLAKLENDRAEFKKRKRRERDAQKAKSAQRLGEKDKELRRRKSVRKPKEIPPFIREVKRRKPRKSTDSPAVTTELEKDFSTTPGDKRRPKGDDPLLSLPIETKHLRNSRRISQMRDENDIALKKSPKYIRKRLPLPISSDMFFRIVVISRSLSADLHNTINWTQVSNSMPGIAPDHAKSAWPSIRDSYGDSTKVDLIQKGWEKIFLQAYEDGDLPIFEDNNYDLAYLARFWARKYPRIHEQSDVPLLFDSREANERKYVFNLPENLQRDSPFFTAQSMRKCSVGLTRHSFSYDRHNRPILQSELTKVKIGLKSIIATTDENYNKERAKDVLEKLGKETCAAATKEMDVEKAIVYVPTAIDENSISERNFLFSEKFMSSLKNRFRPHLLFDMNLFYNELLSTLNESKGYILSRMTQTTSVISVLDLLCYEKVDLVRVNAEKSAFTHNSRKIDKNIWECDIVVRTPLRYVDAPERHQIKKLERVNASMIPLDEPASTIWTDINGQLSKPIFRRLVQWVLTTIEARPGINFYELHYKIQLVLSQMEMEQLLEWLIQLECLRKDENTDGYWVMPEWYVNVTIS